MHARACRLRGIRGPLSSFPGCHEQKKIRAAFDGCTVWVGCQDKSESAPVICPGERESERPRGGGGEGEGDENSDPPESGGTVSLGESIRL